MDPQCCSVDGDDDDFLASVAFRMASRLLEDVDNDDGVNASAWKAATVMVPQRLIKAQKLGDFFTKLGRTYDGAKCHVFNMMDDTEAHVSAVTFTGSHAATCCAEVEAIVAKHMAGFLVSDVAPAPGVLLAPMTRETPACVFINHSGVHDDGRIARATVGGFSKITRMNVSFKELKRCILMGRRLECAFASGLMTSRLESTWKIYGVEAVAVDSRTASGRIPENIVYERAERLLNDSTRKPGHFVLVCPHQTFYPTAAGKTYEALCVRAIQQGWTVEILGWRSTIPESFFLLSASSGNRMVVRLFDNVTGLIVQVVGPVVPLPVAVPPPSPCYLRTTGCSPSQLSSSCVRFHPIAPPSPPSPPPPSSPPPSPPSPPLPPLPPLVPVMPPLVPVMPPLVPVMPFFGGLFL